MMSSPPAQVLVLGLGNDILTDDSVGLRIVDAARLRLAGDPRIELRSTTEMGLALLDEIADRDCLLLVDAVQTGRASPGHLSELDPAELTGPLATVPHFLGIRETLALGALLGLTMPRHVRILAIEVADPYTLGTELTPAVAAVVDCAVDRVTAIACELAGRAKDPAAEREKSA